MKKHRRKYAEIYNQKYAENYSTHGMSFMP